jgi:hypothetical protein
MKRRFKFTRASSFGRAKVLGQSLLKNNNCGLTNLFNPENNYVTASQNQSHSIFLKP